jgi:hypothetical protein
MTTFAMPTIHLNGTSSDELLQQALDPGRAVTAAMAMLSRAAPNGRDYYPQGPSATTTAMREHQERLAKLQDVLDDLHRIAEHISEAS